MHTHIFILLYLSLSCLHLYWYECVHTNNTFNFNPTALSFTLFYFNICIFLLWQGAVSITPNMCSYLITPPRVTKPPMPLLLPALRGCSPHSAWALTLCVDHPSMGLTSHSFRLWHPTLGSLPTQMSSCPSVLATPSWAIQLSVSHPFWPVLSSLLCPTYWTYD